MFKLCIYKPLYKDSFAVLGIVVLPSPSKYRLFVGWWMIDIGRNGFWFEIHKGWNHPVIKRKLDKLGL